MKIRRGFVSNSSSSSFVVIGIKAENSNLEKIGWFKLNEEDQWLNYGYKELEDGLMVVGWEEPYMIGINAESMFKKDMRLSEIKTLVTEKLKDNYGIEISPANLIMETNEWGI